MSYLVPSSNFIQASMLRLYFGFISVGLIVAIHSVHAAPQDQSLSASELDLFSLQISYSHNAKMPISQFSGYSVATKSVLNASLEPRFIGAITGDTFNLPTFTNLKIESIWATSIRWHLVSNSDRASLVPVIRVESEENKLEIRPVQRTVRIMWHKALP